MLPTTDNTTAVTPDEPVAPADRSPTPQPSLSQGSPVPTPQPSLSQGSPAPTPQPSSSSSEPRRPQEATEIPVRDRLRVLDDLAQRPLSEHPDVYQGLHADLQAALAKIDSA